MQTFETPDGINIRFETDACPQGECRGTVIVLGGRTEFIEKYSETVDELRKRRFHVFTFDWRGQGLSDRMLPDRHKGHVESFDDYLMDLGCLMTAHVQPRAVRPVVILAHSMGAHMALRYLHDHPGSADCAVLTSPLFDIDGPPWVKRCLRRLVDYMTRLGLKTLCAAPAKNWKPSRRRFRGNRLTRDRDRFQATADKIAANPKLAVGGATFGWLAAMFASVDILLNADYCQTIGTPTLIVSAGADKIVSNNAQRLVCGWLPNCRLASIANARHELLIETDAVRKRFWTLFEAFVPGPGEK